MTMKSYLVAVVVSAAIVFAAHASAHPFHISNAECTFNAETGKVEIALRVWPVDLERGLSRMVDHPVDLVKDPDVDKLLLRYLDENLIIRNVKPAPSATPQTSADADATKAAPVEPTRLKWTWIGKELSDAECWLYVEAPLPPAGSDLTITNSLFFGHSRDQANTLILKSDGKTSSIITRVGSATKPLTHSEPAAK